MSRKTPQSQTSPQASVGVDFLVRTMIEREATGKRPIRPKNVEDLLESNIQDESDDPDFDWNDEDSDSEGTGGSDEEEGSKDSGEGENDGDSDESDDEDYKGKKGDESDSSGQNDDSGSDSASSNDESDGSDSDEPEVAKKSALRETLQKLNETNNFLAKKRTKKKRKIKKATDTNQKKKSTGKSETKSAEKAKTNLKKKASKTKQTKKGSKTKKSVIAKKSKVSNKKHSEKRKKRRRLEEKSKSKQRSIASLLDTAIANQKENRKEIEVTKPICSACLGDKSDDSNEIVECDSCGISVHEICYGLSADNVSISSGSGSSSCTEPWFCDVCKSGSENIYCELCPVEGGLFKESTAGRWVHLVCAMYTQGVALHNDSTINLYEIHYSRWGSHDCGACENERQAQTGIVISCDAGMCKTYFHATCAQRLGLLSDPNQVDFAEADPYYVSCKLHTNRETMKRRVKVFNTLQEQLRIKVERKESEGLPSGVNADQARILRKLEKVRQKTALKRAHYLNSLDNVHTETSSVDQQGYISALDNLPNSWTNGNKKQRLMHTSAKIGHDFLRKTDRIGEDIVALELEVKHEKIFSNVKRKWNVLPAMSVEFSAYYADRENRISLLMDQCEKLGKENADLIDKEIGLKDVYETHDVNQAAMREETESVSKQLQSLANLLTAVCPGDKKFSSKIQNLARPKELFGGRRKSPSISKGDRKSPTPRRSSTSKKSHKNRVLSPSPSRAGKLAIAVCDTCSTSDNQHLITRCDKCKKHYHLGCLDPPLSRMPKRSRLCGWMCSDCCEAPSETEESHVDTEAPRTLRGRTKIRKPGKYRGSDESEDDGKPPSETDSKPTTRRTPLKSNAAVSEPSEVIQEPLASPVSISSERKRRSSSISLLSPSQMSPQITTPNVKVDLPAPIFDGKVLASPNIVVSAEENNTSGPKPSKRKNPKAKSKTVKVKLPKRLSKAITGVAKSKNDHISDMISPSKRRSSDGPLTNFKINGVSEPTIPAATANITSVVAKVIKKKKKAISKPDLTLTGEELSINGVTLLETELPIPQKPKRKSKKKKAELATATPAPSTNAIIKAENTPEGVVVTEKRKRSRKKKDKAAIVDEANEGEKKGKKKSGSPRASLQSTNFAGRDETNGVNLAMGKVTSQFLEDKMRIIQNGTVKVPSPKKRKNSSSAAMALSGIAATSAVVNSVMTPPDEKEKEKCVPPKKRKRAPSNAQSVPSSVDSIIKAVSSGDYASDTLENGEHDFNSSDVSTIMQGMAHDRQLRPDQNLMQGNAMGFGSGASSGETVTVTASYIIDGLSPSSSQSMGSPISTFYSSTRHASSKGIANDDGVFGNDGFQFQSGGSSSSGGDNVIRLQYIDSGVDAPSNASDALAMPPPAAPSATSPNIFTPLSGVCATCTKTDIKMQLVMCDKCQFEFHFMCLNPPLKYSPRRKGFSWFCKNCDDGESIQENGVSHHTH